MPDNTSVKQLNPVSLSEVGGLLVGATVNCRVTADGDYSEGELYEHIDDVTTDSALAPFPGTALDASLPNLIVTRREVVIESNRIANVACHYEFVNKLLNNDAALTTPANSIRQVVSDTDPSGTEITVEANDSVQCAEVSALEANNGFRVKLQGKPDTPGTVRDGWLLKVNSSAWTIYGGAAETWLCTAFDWTPLDMLASPKLWIFDLEFRHKPRDWRPSASWILPTIGLSPGSLDSSGRKRVEGWYGERDFNDEPAEV